MKWAWLVFLVGGIWLGGALANENDELAREAGTIHQELEGALKQIQQQTGSFQDGLPGGLAGGLPGGLVGDAQVRLMRLATDQHFLQALRDLREHKNRKLLLIVDLGFFVLMWLLKNWRLSKSTHWFKRAVTGSVFSFFTWIGVAFVVPYFVLGDPFRVVILSLWKVLAG